MRRRERETARLLKDSFKYMLLTLLAALLLLLAALLLLNGEDIFAPRGAGTEAAGNTPAPTPVTIDVGVVAGSTAHPSFLPTPSPSPSPLPTPTPDPDAALKAYIAGMPVRDKLGQMVLFGFSGTNAPSEAFRALVDEYAVGNAMLYGPNIVSGDADGGFARARTLTDALGAAMDRGIPPLVGIDVEGGTVVRFRWDSRPASARTLGRNNSAELAFSQFSTIGRQLYDCGINLDLAPVLDVAAEPMDTFLTTRILSDSAEVAANMGAAVIGGLHDGGVLSAAKHFPGHGGTAEDSHDTTPVVDRGADELAAYDLVPFRAAVGAGVDVVLVAHILYPALDANDIASMSAPVMTDLLRGELGFTGVVMSDDFRMGGLTGRYAPGEAAVKFVLAGGDLILCGAQPDRQRAILEGLTAAAADGTLTEARIDESVLRILRAKARVTGFAPPAA